MKNCINIAFVLSFTMSFYCDANQSIPNDFVTINTFIPEALFDIKYHSKDNFVGEVIDGYNADKCILHKAAANALMSAYRQARDAKLNLKIFDCYRPQRAVNHFIRWVNDLNNTATKHNYYPNLAKNSLLGPYIAAKSGHSRGSTLDLTLVKKVNGQWQELDMGSAFDLFDPLSNTENSNISELQRKNRLLLKKIMIEAGFLDYDMEWWHFTLKNQAYPNHYFDFEVL
ncbi:M15 family metallopeptidase [Colwellia sp. RSH04]|uniref:M15 family metallopeptidase n=1 Tax=Colwellia sp. RSH04 TaxID=2305464 RepID=UPI000E5876AB|nr:M15 family metallopeptidase [Colwellia sp. RSH04]RHW76496.1 peptidase M15 [Colwellia sp. RSH04]